jgi:outer membrane protein assembly factor BamB
MAKGVKGGERYVKTLADGSITVAPGQLDEVAYVPASDTNLYAVGMLSGTVRWRFTSATPVIYHPAVTNQDVFVSTERGGLHRLDRSSGRQVWQHTAADRFLAANPKFVYAADRSGRLLVLDRGSGAQLSTYDARDYVVPVMNELTDRVYLGANNGLLVCLHDRDYAKPVQNKKVMVYKKQEARVGGGKAGDKKAKEKDKPKADEKEGGMEEKP